MLESSIINRPATGLQKCPTGIQGLDEITDGGLPRGRTTLVCGTAGCGKSLLAMEFLVQGAVRYDEPGVFVAFEESAEELTQNVASLGFDLRDLTDRGKISLDHIRVERSEIEETGEYDLEGLFIRLGFAIDEIGAKRVVLDTIESLFSGLSNSAILRAELRRLFGWLKEKGVTAIITGERGDGMLTRQGLEEYVSDCVILLDHRVTEQVSTRRLRIVKYRGSTHGTNEYPFLIDEGGLSVLPITSSGLSHAASEGRVSSGVGQLDSMLGGEGYFRGSSVLVSGTAGTGKSSLAAHFAKAGCDRGEKCVYFAFEESQDQIVRNMRSIGVDLRPHLESGALRILASRPTIYGLETHLAVMHKLIDKERPDLVVIDPMSNLISIGNTDEVRAMLTRLVDLLKSRLVTAFFTHLSHGVSGDTDLRATDYGISSVMDTWLLLKDIEIGGERNRGIYVLKSRGMAHSNQIREFVITSRGIDLLEVYTGPEGVLTGSARLAQEAKEDAATAQRKRETERRHVQFERKRRAIAAQIANLEAELEADELELSAAVVEERALDEREARDRIAMARSRKSGATAPEHAPGACAGDHR